MAFPAEMTVLFDLPSLEIGLGDLINDIGPLEVERFPDDFRSYIDTKFTTTDGVVLISLRTIDPIILHEGATGFSFTFDLVVLFKSLYGTDAHTGGYRIISGIITSLADQTLLDNDVHYAIVPKGARFIDQQNNIWIWAVRVQVRPTLSLGR